MRFAPQGTVPYTGDPKLDAIIAGLFMASGLFMVIRYHKRLGWVQIWVALIWGYFIYRIW